MVLALAQICRLCWGRGQAVWWQTLSRRDYCARWLQCAFQMSSCTLRWLHRVSDGEQKLHCVQSCDCGASFGRASRGRYETKPCQMDGKSRNEDETADGTGTATFLTNCLSRVRKCFASACGRQQQHECANSPGRRPRSALRAQIRARIRTKHTDDHGRRARQCSQN
jgi:hypothetical protein